MTHPVYISPSILAADTTRLGELVHQAERGGADSIHIDVMDGHYVANFAFSPKTIEDLRRITPLPLHIHLEVANPDDCISLFSSADLIIVQEDATSNLGATIQRICQVGAQVGVGVNPGRAVEQLTFYLDLIDLLVIMGVEPGFGGQPFNAAVLQKALWAAEKRAQSGFHFTIGLDGGVNATTIQRAAQAGVDVFIAGTAVFGDNPTAAPAERMVAANIAHLRSLAQREHSAPPSIRS